MRLQVGKGQISDSGKQCRVIAELIYSVEQNENKRKHYTFQTVAAADFPSMVS